MHVGALLRTPRGEPLHRVVIEEHPLPFEWKTELQVLPQIGVADQTAGSKLVLQLAEALSWKLLTAFAIDAGKCFLTEACFCVVVVWCECLLAKRAGIEAQQGTLSCFFCRLDLDDGTIEFEKLLPRKVQSSRPNVVSLVGATCELNSRNGAIDLILFIKRE